MPYEKKVRERIEELAEHHAIPAAVARQSGKPHSFDNKKARSVVERDNVLSQAVRSDPSSVFVLAEDLRIAVEREVGRRLGDLDRRWRDGERGEEFEVADEDDPVENESNRRVFLVFIGACLLAVLILILFLQLVVPRIAAYQAATAQESGRYVYAANSDQRGSSLTVRIGKGQPQRLNQINWAVASSTAAKLVVDGDGTLTCEVRDNVTGRKSMNTGHGHVECDLSANEEEIR